MNECKPLASGSIGGGAGSRDDYRDDRGMVRAGKERHFAPKSLDRLRRGGSSAPHTVGRCSLNLPNPRLKASGTKRLKL